MSVKHFEALALLVGTIIGVGVFALPFSFWEAGFLVGALELLVLAAAILSIHLMYGDVALSIAAPHQLPGYARHYLGGAWAKLAAMVAVVGLTGAMVAYIILGSAFLETLLQGIIGSSFSGIGFWLFLLLGAFIFFYDRFFAMGTESFLTFLLIVTLLALIFFGFSGGNFLNLIHVNLPSAALPYGVILFALAGASVIPRVRQVLPGRGEGLRGIIIAGTLIPAFLYLLFAASIISGSAPYVSRDSISGLLAPLGVEMVLLGSVVGVLAVITSFIGIGLTFKSVLVNDFKFPARAAWLASAFFPPALVAFGVSDYIRIIGLVGTFMVGIESLLILKIWRVLPAHRIFRVRSSVVPYALLCVFLIGVAYEVIMFFS